MTDAVPEPEPVPEPTPPPAVPTAFCPTCKRPHPVALMQGQDMTLQCPCGKLLKIERGNGDSLVVSEQIPDPPPPPETPLPPIAPAPA